MFLIITAVTGVPHVTITTLLPYIIVLVGLNWENADFNRKYDKTGLRILDSVRDYAPKRVLWTSDANKYREESLRRGATACIEKTVPQEEFAKAIGFGEQ